MQNFKSGKQRSGCHNDLASACFVSMATDPSSAVWETAVLSLENKMVSLIKVNQYMVILEQELLKIKDALKIVHYII